MHRDARPPHGCATVERPLTAAAPATPRGTTRILRRVAGLLLLLCVLPVFLLGMAVALPVAVLVGGADAMRRAWDAMRVHLHVLHDERDHHDR